MDDDTSKQLVEDSTRGDRRALEALLLRHVDYLRAFVRLRCGRLVRARESHSDIVQSVCREVLQDLGAFEYRGEAAFRHWLCQAARRKIIDRVRHLSAARRDPAREVAADADSAAALAASYGQVASPSEHVAAHELLERVEGAMARLRPDDREIITLARVVGLPHAEIANATGRSPSAVKVHLSRALARLSRYLPDAG